MSVSSKSSVKHTSKIKKCTSLRRRQNQKAEIDELASHFQLLTPAAEQGACDNKTSAIDKLSVLRLTTAFLNFQNFLKDIFSSSIGNTSPKKEFLGLMEEAMDGFLIVLDKDANILYVSENIVDCVGLRQQDMIGQNLVDSTHSLCANEIIDSLKPSVTISSSVVENCVISQFRQFHLVFRSTVSSSRNNSYTMVQVHGNLKVKMPPLKKSSGHHHMEVVQPSVIGFVGVCDLIESATSAEDISIPNNTFTWTYNYSSVTESSIVSVEGSVQEVIGYNPKVFQADNIHGFDFVHPDDLKFMPSEKILKFVSQAGHVVLPHFRVLNSLGEWVWMQAEIALQYKNGTTTPDLYDLKCRALSHGRGKLRYIMQREIHASIPNPGQDPLNPHMYTALVIPKPISISTTNGSNKPLSTTGSCSASIIAHNGSGSIDTIDSMFRLPNHPQGLSVSPSSASMCTQPNFCHDPNAIPQASWAPPLPLSNSFTPQPQLEQLNGEVSSPPLSGSRSRSTPTCSTLTTTSYQFQNSHQIIPQGSRDFNPQIPINFNFSSDTASYYSPNNCPSSAFAPYVNGSPQDTQIFATSDPSIIYPAYQAQNDPSTSFRAVAPVLNWHTNMDLVPLQFQCMSGSNHEVQDTFQQFV